MANRLISNSPAWQALLSHSNESIPHLRELLTDRERYVSCTAEYDNILLDFSRQRITNQTLSLLFDLAEAADLRGKIAALAAGAIVNTSEQRPAMHIALRAAPTDIYKVNGENVVPAVHSVWNSIKLYSDKVRNGSIKGYTKKSIKNIVAIGIGGSYLGANFVYESLRNDSTAHSASVGRELRFLANVDPVAVSRALEGLNPAETIAIVISKTFTTRETMLNARTVRDWFIRGLGSTDSIKSHMIAVSTNLAAVQEFGIDSKSNTFEFWDWVGGRYSVTSAVGLLPLSLHFGAAVVDRFLAGCRSIDQNFLHSAPRENLPYLLGLLGVWNTTFLGYKSRALIPYSEALCKLAPHIQQVDMESNGKRVTSDGIPVDFNLGPVDFGEPGTNAQHSFFQLLHQGQVVPVDFIGFHQSQQPIELKGDDVSNHDELMANFFAQPDALAIGKTELELEAEKVPANLIPHRVFPGNRPSNILLLPKLTAYEVGQLLSLYEHRTVVEGFIWGINSFDQWGVELGKKLADQIRNQLINIKKGSTAINTEFNPSTAALLKRYTNPAKSKL